MYIEVVSCRLVIHVLSPLCRDALNSTHMFWAMGTNTFRAMGRNARAVAGARDANLGMEQSWFAVAMPIFPSG